MIPASLGSLLGPWRWVVTVGLGGQASDRRTSVLCAMAGNLALRGGPRQPGARVAGRAVAGCSVSRRVEQPGLAWLGPGGRGGRWLGAELAAHGVAAQPVDGAVELRQGAEQAQAPVDRPLLQGGVADGAAAPAGGTLGLGLVAASAEFCAAAGAVRRPEAVDEVEARGGIGWLVHRASSGRWVPRPRGGCRPPPGPSRRQGSEGRLVLELAGVRRVAV